VVPRFIGYCKILLYDCTAVRFHRGTLFQLHEEHFKVIREMLIWLNDAKGVEEALFNEVEESKQDSHMNGRRRLRKRLEVIPESFEVMTRAFKRNPDVIAEVLIRADGVCEKCNQHAPLKRATVGTPFLEVHHIIRLADGGEDKVDNTIAVCPNCHRELHYR
jgi:predicted HNH restriction endonuclease